MHVPLSREIYWWEDRDLQIQISTECILGAMHIQQFAVHHQKIS